MRPIIQPLVLFSLDVATAELGGAVTLGLAARQPHALPFFCSLAFDARREDEAEHVREAFRMATDLGERQAALLAGHAVRDSIRVVLALRVGAAGIEDSLVATLEHVRRIGGNFFDQTPIEVHALAFLPDLAHDSRRDGGYEHAYRQLCLLDSLSAPDTDAARNCCSIEYRWLFDCRSHSGAHAGAIEEVLEPAARLVTLLADGEADALHGAGAAHAASLAATALGRRTAYSSFSAATLFHDPGLLARALAARAAALHLASHGIAGTPAEPGSGPPEKHPTAGVGEGEDEGTAGVERAEAAGFRHEESRDGSLERVDDRERVTAERVAVRVAAWAERAQLRARLEQPTGMARLEPDAVAAVREWLAEGGIPFATRVLAAAEGAIVEDEVDSVAPAISLASMRAELNARAASEATAPLSELERGLDAYEVLLGRLRGALDRYTADLKDAVEYYQRTAAELERAITTASNFRRAALARSDVERYASAHVPALREALRTRTDASHLSGAFTLAPPPDALVPPAGPEAASPEVERSLLETFDAKLMKIAGEVLRPVLDERLADIVAGRGIAPARFTASNLARMLVEAAQPLVRPQSIDAISPPVARRWLVAHESMHEWIAADEEAARVLEQAGVLMLGSTNVDSIVLGATLHGFPAFAVQKVLELRARAAVLGAARSASWPDLVPLELARVRPATERVFRTLVLARALGLISTDDHCVTFRDNIVVGDLLDVVHAIAFDATRRALDAELDGEVATALANAAGLEQLRRALDDGRITEVERRVVLEVIADIEALGTEAMSVEGP